MAYVSDVIWRKRDDRGRVHPGDSLDFDALERWLRTRNESQADELAETADDPAFAPEPVFEDEDETADDPVVDPEAVVENEDDGASQRPQRGTIFDPNVEFRDQPGDLLTAEVLALLDEIEPPRQRQRRAIDEDNRLALVRSVLANGLCSCWHRSPPITSYFQKPDAEVYQAADKPCWYSANAMCRVVEWLKKANLIDLVTGKREIASSYAATPKLIEMAAAVGVKSGSLRRRVPTDQLVKLYGKKPKPDYDVFDRKLVKYKGPRIEFEPTPETQAWTADLKAINDFLAEQDISVELSAEQEALWAAELNADEIHTGADFQRPELTRTDVYRVFNNGCPESPTFNEGGRMFGGWWMNAPRELRPHIRINGQPTIELDYKACHPNMLYHERGLVCEGEAYELPVVSEYEKDNGLPPETYRESNKELTQILINGGKRPDLAERKEEFPPGFSLEELIQMIEQRHQPIADSFRTGAGLRLMRVESDIALDVVSTARREGWTALPLHDSFITTEDKEGRLRMLMEERYEQTFKIKPTIKKKTDPSNNHSPEPIIGSR